MKVVTGKMFKKMVINAANTLHNNHEQIDVLNVFPVPDGDTGTNMSLTFTNGANEIKGMETDNIYEIARKLSKGLLMGARGNSGVILSQIFRGFAAGLKDHEEADAVLLAKAFKQGAKVAYKAVMRPVEGTILTVIREASEAGVKYAKKGMEIEELMAYFVKSAETALDHTPDLLPVLKEVGVVDSGGAGLLLVLVGFVAALHGDDVEYIEGEASVTKEKLTKITSGEEGFGYCTEFIIRLNPKLIESFDKEQLKKELERIPGNSIVCVQDEDIVKVHVHTLKPGVALNTGQKFGEFVKLKIENMQEQADQIQRDSIVGVDDKKLRERVVETKEIGIVSVCVGSGLEQAFIDLRCDHIVSGGQTMNPSAEDMVRAIKSVNARNVIVLPNNSNIVMTANQAKDILDGEINVEVIATKTIPQGLGACTMYNPDASLEENLTAMKEEAENIKTGQVTYAIKDTNIDGITIKEGDYMAIVGKEIVDSSQDKLDALKVTLEKIVNKDEDELITLIVGEDVNDSDVESINSFIEDNYDLEIEIIFGKQPVYSFIVGVE